MEIISRVVARYSQGREEPEVEVLWSREAGGEAEQLTLRVAPMTLGELEPYRINR
jgi:hypothetical protein